MADDAQRTVPGVPAPAVAVAAAVGLAAAGYGGGNAVGALVDRTLAALGIDPGVTAGIAVSVVLLQGVAFGGLSVAYLSYRGVDLREYVGVRVPDLEGWMYVGAGYVLAFVAAFATIFTVVFVLGLTPAQNQVAEAGQADPRAFLLLVALAFLLIGPGEELLFRGVIQSRLRETFSAPPAVGLATAIFAAVHAPGLVGPLEGRLVTVAMLFVPGLVFGVTYELTDNLVVPSVVHGAYNATLFALAYLSLAFG